MNILHIASEVAPYAKTGGLADVVGSLPRALAAVGAQRGDRVVVVTPRYRADPSHFGLARRLERVPVALGAHSLEVSLLEGRLPGGGGRVDVWLLDHPLYDRAGIYGEHGRDYPDNALRFALLARGALAAARAHGFQPDVVHAHDWQAAPALLFAKRGDAPSARTVLTIHNVAFLGQFGAEVVGELGLGRDLFHPGGIEFYGGVSFLKAGILFADWISTVSPRYALEIQTPELGGGLDGLLRSRAGALVGILNGADYDQWNPERDPAIAAPFDARDLDGKALCKRALQRTFGLPLRPRAPLTGAVSRLSHQKGFDLVAEVAARLLGDGREAQLVVLGAGDPELEQRLTELAATHPSRIAVRIGYDEQLSHQIYAGSDLYLMPSRYEPCGLAQLYAMRYGAPPIVRATGGLDDTVVDVDQRSHTGTGFKFGALDAAALERSWRRALEAYADPDFPSLQRRDMRQDFSWRRSAEGYRMLYER